MCGICGAIGLGSQEAGEVVARRMTAALIHRGPDEDGYLFTPTAALGMRRLSIIDLPGGRQPIWNEDGTLAIVFNGEIYNFRELRQKLEAAGHRFRTSSDTEVIVHAYEEWGEACLERLHGMFAFAIAEMPQGARGAAASVFIARDPLGIKPLYYAHADGALIFASEVRAVLASGCVQRQLSSDAVTSYLLFGSVGEPLTLVDGIFSLPPGHSMRISATRPARASEPKPYAFAGLLETIANGERDGKSSSGKIADPAQKVRSLLDTAVKSHLVADVPVGVFLSSGLDSTAIAALAARSQQGIHTFTVAFPDLEFSEAEMARRTAKTLGTQHSELTLSGHDMMMRLDEAIEAFDQPSMDGVNTYFVSWAARQAGLKVALSGLGSDELFGGYTSFRATRTLAKLAGAARFLPRSLRSAGAKIFSDVQFGGQTPDASRKALSAWQDASAFPADYFFTRLLFTPEKIARAMGEEPETGTDTWKRSAWWQWFSTAASQTASMDDFTKISWLELRSYMASTLLRDTDAMSMRHSLEVRVPFLDLPLVEGVLSIPESQKFNREQPKSLLTEALRDILPGEIIAQRKRTFTFPWDTWFRGDLGRRIEQGFDDWSPVLEPLVGRKFAIDTWSEFLKGRTSWSRPWSLYVLNEWVKRHFSSAEVGAREEALLKPSAN